MEKSKPLIALVEDEKDVADLVLLYLQREGYSGHHFLSGEGFLESLSLELPDLILLDLMLPGINGIELCRQLKLDPVMSTIPIIMLTAKDDDIDIVLGLEVGADDYVTKPFHPRVLMSRIKTVLRRFSLTSASDQQILKVGIYSLNPNELAIRIGEDILYFSWKEYRIIEMLVKNRGKIVSRDQILNEIWGMDAFIAERIVDVYIANIRKKMGIHGESITTIRGAGYRFDG